MDFFRSIRDFFRFNPRGRDFSKKVLISKWLNNPLYKRVYLSYVRKKAEKLAKAPPAGICIETTSGCNARCVMCPRGMGRGRESGVMTMDLFRKILNDCEKIGQKNIELNVFGEPLVDPFVFERIREAKVRGFYVSFFSNGALLFEDKAQKLIDLKCDRITFSVDGFTKETYESIRIGLLRDVVYRNINRLLELKQEQKSALPEVSVSGILMDRNEKEMKDFLRYWQSRNGVKHVLIASLRNWSGTFSEAQIGKLGDLSKAGVWRPPCLQLWQGLNIFYDGKVPICCDDAAEGRIIIGDISKESIDEVWRGQNLRKLREMHLAEKQNQISICKECPRITVWW